MAKNAGRLAGLAALAGAAYMMSKDKDKDKEGPAATPAEKDASEARTKAQRDAVSGNKSTENKVETPAETIARSDKSADKYNITDENYSNEGRGKGLNQAGASGTTTLGPGYNKSDKPNKPEPPKKSGASSSSSPAKPVASEAGTSRGTRPADTSKMYPPGVMGGAKQADTKSSAVKNAVSDATKTAVKTVTEGPATSAKPAASPAMRETYRDLSGKVKYKEPSGPSASQIASDAVASGAKKIGSGIADYAKRTFTLEGREQTKKEAEAARAKAASSREFNEDALSTGSAMRRGGKVKKMASGGMTASRRADGIASRGKTRCKMY